MDQSNKAVFLDGFGERYTLRELLWTSSYSRVYKAVENFTKNNVAVKIMSREYYESTEENKEVLRKTLNDIFGLSHPNIVRTLEIYKDEGYYYVIMEYIDGKNLLDYIKTLPNITEKVVADIMKDLLSAISHAHKKSVIHGNLSFYNAIITKIEGIPVLKVVGFAGSPSFVDNNNPTLKNVIFYSPEKAARKEVSSYASDVWACGIICSSLLSGLIPFTVKNYVQDTLEEIAKCDVTMEKIKGGSWTKVSDEAKQFLLRMLIKDPSKRSSSGALLHDKWISNKTETITISEDFKVLCTQMEQAKALTTLQNAVLYYMSDKAKYALIESKMGPLLKELDKAGTGKISKPDFISMLKKLRISEQMKGEEIFSKIDVTGDGLINYTEIIAALFGRKLAMRDENLKIAFDNMDKDKSGDLTSDEIIAALCGADKGGDMAKKILKELEGYKGGRITYSDFITLMKTLS